MDINNIENNSFNQPKARQLSLFLNLDGFEGPIDLLLHLAREQKVDLSCLSILQLADQYILFIKNMQRVDIEIAADYLVMASWLAYLKSRTLLPDQNKEEDNNEINYATEELRERLLRLEAMQKAGKEIMSLPRLGWHRYQRGEKLEYKNSVKINFKTNLYELLTVYGQIQTNKNEKELTIHSSKLYSVQEAVDRLTRMFGSMKDWIDLKDFLPSEVKNILENKSILSSHFVAALELVNKGSLKIRQDIPFGKLWMKKS